MMKTKRFLALALLAALLCSLTLTDAAAWALSGRSTLRRGQFTNDGVTFTVPASFVLDSTSEGEYSDKVIMSGPKDVNGFIPTLTIFVLKAVRDLEAYTLEADMERAEINLRGSNAICLADEPIKVNGTDGIRRIIFFNYPDDRMGILIRYHFNLDNAHVLIDYNTRTATRSLPSDVQALMKIAESVKVK